MNIDFDFSIRMLNIGVLLFTYSVLCFSISFTKISKQSIGKHIYLLLAIIPIIEIIFYDQKTYVFMHTNIIKKFDIDMTKFNSFDNSMNCFFKIVNFSYLASAFLILFKYYKTYPKIKFIKKFTLYNMLGLFPIVAVHFLMFSWVPKRLIRATMIKGYYHNIVPDLGHYILLFKFFPYIVFFAFSFIIILIYKYNSIETYYKNKNVHINRSIDTATLGMRTFTHSIKNHLLAIKSETDFLKDKYVNDEETIYSLNLILDSCSKSLNSFDLISNRLKDITLNLYPLKLDIPVEKAISRFMPLKPNIHITTSYCKQIPSAYIDEQHMSEVIFNIISNAIEAINKKSTGVITIGIESRDAWGIISITDNGIGISEEHINNIFLPFVSTKPSTTNWGVGLSYCHKIVTGHDGKIVVESREGFGTTFKIMLPIL